MRCPEADYTGTLRRQAILVVLLTIVLRAPFLDIGAQWDDFNYLTAAKYSLQNPLHPAHARYVFLGEWHDMKGHPHPPGVAWTLGLLWRILGGFREIPFHAAFLGFNILAGLAGLILARRWVPRRALVAACLFLATPALAVSGTSFESDLPFLACWLASVAFLSEALIRGDRRLAWGSAILGGLAALFAYQAILLAAVLGLLILCERSQRRAWVWAPVVAPLIVLGAYQAFEAWTAGSLPLGVLSGHMRDKGWDALALKLRSGAALTAHLSFVLSLPLILAVARKRLLWWQWVCAAGAALAAGFALGDPSLLFVAPFFAGLLLLLWLAGSCARTPFLAGASLLFFAAACAIFFAGAQRYLLPLAPLLAILACRELEDRPKLLWAGVAFQLLFALAAGIVNRDHWNQTRSAALAALPDGNGRTFVSGEWGIRWYMEEAGAQPLTVNAALEPGDRLVANELNGRIPYRTGGGTLVTRAVFEIVPRLPLRLAGLDAKSGYAAVSFGLRPFDFSRGPVDRITVSDLVAAAPVLSWLPMNAPSAGAQIVAGVYGLEQNEWRWAERRAAFLLKRPDGAGRAVADIYLPPMSPARRFEVRLNGVKVGESTVPGEGAHRLEFPAPRPEGDVKLEILADRDFRQGADQRALSFIVRAVGFQP